MALKEGPYDAMPDGWSNGTRDYRPSTRNRGKLCNHVHNAMAWALHIDRELIGRDYYDHRHAELLRRAEKHIALHLARARKRMGAELVRSE